ASLEALQQAGLDKLNPTRSQWLQRQGLANAARLAEILRIEPGWEAAFETVLAEDLDSVCVTELRLHESLPQSGITLLDITSPASYTFNEAPDGQSCVYLASKLYAPAAARSLVRGIRCAETLHEAFNKRHSLVPGESIITRDGVWVGHNWLRQRRQQDAHHGMLQRQQEITQLRDQLVTLELQLAELHAQSDTLHDSIRTHEQQRQQLQTEVNHLHRQVAEQRARLQGLQQRSEQLTSRQQQLASEIAELGALQAQQHEELLVATEAHNAALATLEAAQQAYTSLSHAREERQQAVNSARQQQHELQQSLQGICLAVETNRQQRNHSQQQLERLHSRVAQLEQQRDALVEQLHQQADPCAALQLALAAAQQTRLQIEQRLNQARKSLQVLETSMRQHDERRLQAEHTAEQIRRDLESRKLEWQTLQVREQTLAEQFAKSEYPAAELQAELQASGATLPALQAQMDAVQRNIQRLGAINLAAIDDYREYSERKHYLDQQHADLSAALDTLEAAIRKIDRETRARFKQTLEWVNHRLGEMFPRLFGGGECYLEMTGDDLLTTGVAIMARPPGKRISSIYLLSGGEKALTALALVFAIFELNPAPFCMLDEVDPPLDEANVGRFCELVRHMAERVQFIFITHNKTTMELADNLIGV
ncbi:MAG: chromosome segregation protein SMC, partial [Thiothrix sp.]